MSLQGALSRSRDLWIRTSASATYVLIACVQQLMYIGGGEINDNCEKIGSFGYCIIMLLHGYYHNGTFVVKLEL